MDTDQEVLFYVLKLNGPTFYGSNDKQTTELADEWLYRFDLIDAIDWINAGFWCPTTAHAIAAKGIDPSKVAALCNDNITGWSDPIYHMCNGDLDVDALTKSERFQ